ncbi:hypothetical protein Fmac_011043 [Flemingia macrophylla]|uniref:WPP domain-containing protein n=1 Tax=Flemingia macrophylla TaxID=520843 RepID=A0ABD1MLB3_9FABA
MEAPPHLDPVASAATTFSIWPPSQCNRNVVVNRLVKTLSAPSVLSKRYNTFSSDEAFAITRQMETRLSPPPLLP